MVGLLAYLLLALGCAVDTPPLPTPELKQPIKIGSLLALTGEHKSFGITQRNGIEIALAEINASGGINGRPLEVEFADSRLDADQAQQEYKRLVASGVPAILGVTGSGVALRLAPFAEADRVVLLDSIDTSPELTAKGGTYFFRNIASDAYGGQVLAQWAMERKADTGIVVFNSENDWSTGCRASVEAAYPAAGGHFASDALAVVDSTTDFGPAAAKVREGDAKAVFVCLMGRQAGLFTKQAAGSGATGTFYGTDPFSQQEFIDNAGDALSRSLFALPAAGGDPRYDAFAAEYKKLNASEADGIAAKAYDSAWLMATALRATASAKFDGPSIRDALAAARYEGITGDNSFDTNGDLKTAKFDRFTYKDGLRVAAQ